LEEGLASCQVIDDLGALGRACLMVGSRLGSFAESFAGSFAMDEA